MTMSMFQKRYRDMSVHELLDAVAAAQERENGQTALEAVLEDLQLHQIELEMQNRALLAAQQAVESARERAQTLYDGAPVAYVSLDGRGVIREANRAAEALFAVPVGDLIGGPLVDRVAPECRRHLRAHLRRVASGEAMRTEVRLMSRAGPPGAQDETAMWVELSSLPVQGTAPGQPGQAETWFHTAVLDLTDRKRAESATVQRQKLDSLGVLAAGTAHEFNNLLTGIQGCAELIRQEIPTETAVWSRCEDIEVACSRAAELCRQLLAYAGRTLHMPQSHDVNQLLHAVTASLEHVAAGRGLALDLAPNLPPLDIDPAQLRLALHQLVVNGSEAMTGQPGAVGIATRDVHLDAAALADLWLGPTCKPGRYVAIEVTDAGVGMERMVQERAFDPFFTTKFLGRGLGLSAVQGIVRAHGGAIGLRTAPGEGTSVRLYLPVESPRQREAPPVSPDWRGEGTVLLVEPEAMTRAAVSAVLEFLGFSVVGRATVDEAVADLARLGEEARLVLLDLSPPQTELEEAIRAVRQQQPNARIVLTSTVEHQEAVAQLARDVMAGFVPRPFPMQALMAVLKATLSE